MKLFRSMDNHQSNMKKHSPYIAMQIFCTCFRCPTLLFFCHAS